MLLLPKRASQIELALLVLVTIALSGGPSAFYVKAFAYAPPLPEKTLVLPVILIMGVHILLRLRETVLGILVSWAWLGVALIALTSTRWSISPADTFREASVMLVAVPWLAMMAVVADWRDIVSRMWIGCVILLFLSVALYGLVPRLGKMQDIYAGAFVGLWHEKNMTGQFLSVTAMLSLARLAMRPRTAVSSIIVWGMCMMLLIPAQSATSLVATALATGLVAWVYVMRRHFVISIPGIVMTILLAAPVALLMVGFGDDLLRTLGKSGTLSGRVPIWDALREYALNERPRWGHGYDAYWSDAYSFGRRELVFDQLGFKAHHAHNALIEMRLALGYMGAAFWLAAAVQGTLFAFARIRSSAGAYLAIPFALSALLFAAVEVSLTSVSNLQGVLFVLIVAKMTWPPSEADRAFATKGVLRGITHRTRMAPAPA